MKKALLEKTFTTCKNYDHIVNYNFDSEDEFTNALIKSYVNCILNWSSSLSEKDLTKYDQALFEYTNNIIFNNYLKENLEEFTPFKVIEEFESYLNMQTKSYKITDWVWRNVKN